MRHSARSWLVAILSLPTIARISVDLACGMGGAAVAGTLIAGEPPVVIAVVGLVTAPVAWRIMWVLVRMLAAVARGPLPRHNLVFYRALFVCGALFIVFLACVIPAFVRAPQAVLLLVSGIWACLLTQRRVRDCRYRWVRYATDVLVAAVTGLELLVLSDRDLLTTLPAAGLLVPVGAWFSIRTWRVMAGSRRPAVRAGADIAASLLLGIDLVLFLVWGANLFGLPEAGIAVLRGTLERVGSIADLPWQLWVGLYVLLAGASLASALWPERLEVISRWSQRVRLVPSLDVSRRMLTGVHISLLVIVLIGLAGPASLEATLRGELKTKYTVALQRELESRGEQAAYEEIRQQFITNTTSTSPSMQPLAAIVTKIHNIGGPPPGANDATSTERDLARHLGQLQATTLQLTATHSVLSAHQADLARFDPPIHDVGDLNDRLGRLDTEQDRAGTENRRVNEIAELAATAVASMIQIPGLGENEIVQIIREYLSGLVENSPLKKVFTAWAEHLTGDATPPRAEEMVVPDPARLEQAALTALTQAQAKIQLADPLTPDQVQQTLTEAESPADVAVDLLYEARSLDGHTGRCDGCSQPLPPGHEHYQNPGDDHPVQPGEPTEPVDPDPDLRIPLFID